MLTQTLALALLSSALLAGCGDDSSDAGDDSSTYGAELRHSDFDPGSPDNFNALLELPDGRKVAMYYATGKGLAEQHYSPEEKSWTEPEIIYATKTDPCQGIALDTADGTVAVTADWALYCYDGEPPNESLAGVATGDLTDWGVDLTNGFDGWSAPKVAKDGSGVEWSYHQARLSWTDGEGFDKDLDVD